MEQEKIDVIKEIVKRLNKAGTLGDWFQAECLKQKLLREHNVQWIELENGEREYLQ